MDFDLTPKFAGKMFEGEGGSYYSWSASEFPLLGETKVGGGVLCLKPNGFALPHYADCSKVGYVLAGEGTVGMVLSNTSNEIQLPLRKGFVIPVPLGAISWWLNACDDSDFIMAFLGETCNAYIPGEFTYFLLTGAQGILAGFSPEFVSRALNMEQGQATEIAKNQTGVLIIKLLEEEAKSIAQNYKDDDSVNKYIKKINDFSCHADINVKGGGISSTLTEADFPFLEDVGLSCSFIKLEANAMLSPLYTNNASVQVFYVVNGNGKVQIVGINGKRTLDTKIKTGQLLVVPRFFVVAMIAGGEGMECFSILTTTTPGIEGLATKESGLSAISPTVLQFALNVPKDLIHDLKSNIKRGAFISPP